jgi:pimeloyl-ACP methyl ester carboxylesterase
VPPQFTPSHRGGSGPPLLLLHGFTDTWRSWELVLPALERRHEVLAVTLTGHAGGPPLNGGPTVATLADGVERALDDAGWDTVPIAANSLGGYVALQLAERGRAQRIVALAPAGGWAAGDDSYKATLNHFRETRKLVQAAAPHADAIMATDAGRRTATQWITVRYEHIPPELLVHQMLGVAGCDAAPALIDFALREGWALDPAEITCPLRFVWGNEDRLLVWPGAAARYRADFPTAEWIELDGVGHSPQLDVPVEAAQLILGFTAP